MCDYVTEEIRNSIDFYTATANGLTLSKAYFTGGASLTAGLIDHLQSVIKLRFEVLNPYQNIKTTNKKLTPHYLKQIAPFVAISFGLGIRRFEK